MPILIRALAALLACIAASAAHAQQQQPAPPEVKAAVPAATTPDRQPAPRLPAAGRNAFSNTVMPIDIKGEGLALPAGVAPPEELPKPPAATGGAPTPTAK